MREDQDEPGTLPVEDNGMDIELTFGAFQSVGLKHRIVVIIKRSRAIDQSAARG